MIGQGACYVNFQNTRMTGMTSLNTLFTATFPQHWRNVVECDNLRLASGVSA